MPCACADVDWVCWQVEQHTSPFELSQVSTLVANFGKKFKHETVDNIPDLAPGASFCVSFPCLSRSRISDRYPRSVSQRTNLKRSSSHSRDRLRGDDGVCRGLQFKDQGRAPLLRPVRPPWSVCKSKGLKGAKGDLDSRDGATKLVLAGCVVDSAANGSSSYISSLFEGKQYNDGRKACNHKASPTQPVCPGFGHPSELRSGRFFDMCLVRHGSRGLLLHTSTRVMGLGYGALRWLRGAKI